MTVVNLAPAGRTFVRGMIADALAKSNAAEFAAKRWGVAQADRIAKAAVPALNSNDIGIPEAREFFGLAIKQSLLGRVPGLRRISFNVRFVSQTAGATGYWVSQARPIPLSKPAIEGSTLNSLKVASIVCATKEAVTGMGEATEAGLQADLESAVANALDAAFITPTWAGAADESPASITYAQTQIASTGDARTDIEAMFNAYNGSYRSAVIVMHPKTAVQLGLLDAQLGETKLTVQGGVLSGVPVYCTEAVELDSSGGSITLFDASAVAYAARDLEAATTDQAALAMSDTPASPAEMVSLFQTNTIAWKALAEANWEVQGTGRVVTITGTDYATGV